MNKVFVVLTSRYCITCVDSIWTNQEDAIGRAKEKLANFEPCFDLQVEEWPVNDVPDKFNIFVVWAPPEDDFK